MKGLSLILISVLFIFSCKGTESNEYKNHAPILADVTDQIVNEDEELSFSISATDADNDSLVYSVSPHVYGMNINNHTGAFTWTPENGMNRVYNVTFKVTDGCAFDSKQISITVVDSNSDPVTNTVHQPMKQIGRNMPVFTKDGATEPSSTNDDTYSSIWTSGGSWNPAGAVPVWVAYDLTVQLDDARLNVVRNIPQSEREKILFFWVSSNIFGYYSDIIGHNVDTPLRDCARVYTIDVHAAPGRASDPSAAAPDENDPGWVTKHIELDNRYKSRYHLLDLKEGDGTVYNWVRMHVTDVISYVGPYLEMNVEIYDAGNGIDDTWFFFGDSITAGSMDQRDQVGRGPNFSQLINRILPEYFPPQANAGKSGWTTSDALLDNPNGIPRFIHYMDTFPGKYVTINLGSNDHGDALETFRNNYITMIDTVISRNKVPVIPTIPWYVGGSNKVINFNNILDEIKADYRANNIQIIDGPDLYSYYRDHEFFMATDNIHPTQAGYAIYRRLWANKMLEEVYGLIINEIESDTIGPESVTTITGSFNSDRTSLTLSWEPTADDSGYTYYIVYKDGAFYSSYHSPKFTIYNMVSGQTYNFSVRAVDASGNMSDQLSETYTVTP